MNKIVLNIVEMAEVISKLDEKIDMLENIYKEMNIKMKTIDGSSDIWSGDCQSASYKSYLSIASDFPNSINKMKSLRIFLENTLSSYINSDIKINESIEKNLEGLDLE